MVPAPGVGVPMSAGVKLGVSIASVGVSDVKLEGDSRFPGEDDAHPTDNPRKTTGVRIIAKKSLCLTFGTPWLLTTWLALTA